MALGVVLGIGAGVAVGSRLNLGVSTTLQNLETKAKEGINDLSDAIKSKTNPNLADVKTSFPTKDIGGKKNGSPQKAKAIPESKPKEIRNQFLKPLESLSYFPTAMKYYIGFKIYDKVGKNPLSLKVKKPVVDIYLPMPTNLLDASTLNYDAASIGPLGAAASNVINNLQQQTAASDNLNTFTENLTKKVISNPGELVSQAVDALAAQGISQLKKLPVGGSTINALTRQALRISPNPFLAVIFSNIDLRTHQFSYKFSPRSETELLKLKEIIQNFRKAALPATKNVGSSNDGNYLLGFPYEVEVEFYPDKTVPYFFKPCVITGISFNYAPDGTPAFFKTGDPVAVEFTINLQEMEVITREDIEENEEKGRAKALGLVDNLGNSTTLL